MPRRYIGCCPSDYEQVYEFLGRRRLQARLIAAQLDNGLAPFLRKAAGEVPAEFLFEQGNAFVAAAAMAQRIPYRVSDSWRVITREGRCRNTPYGLSRYTLLYCGRATLSTAAPIAPLRGVTETSEINLRCMCAIRDGFKHPITARQRAALASATN